MPRTSSLDRIAIGVRAHNLLKQLLRENPALEQIMRGAKNETEALIGVRNLVLKWMKNRPQVLGYYRSEHPTHEQFTALRWRDYAAIRILDYVDNAGTEYPDLNLRGEIAYSNPFRLIWLAANRGTGGAKPGFFEDMLELFRQFTGKSRRRIPTRSEVEGWMDRFPSGLDPRIIALREENRDRILHKIIEKIDRGKVSDPRFRFEKGLSAEAKFARALQWWDDHRFHVRFAVRTPEHLNEMLGHSLDPDTMKILLRARKAGIPFFVNPYYLSMLHVRTPYFAIGADLAIRDYVIYSQQLVKEFGHITGWEKEDLVKPGEPNAAGWLLPSITCVHRRYPNVAILIPETTGRACGGLCAPCQRMFDFQRGHLNFDLEALEPKLSWPEKLKKLMAYFENDSQLRDILITGGDALMSHDKTLKELLDAVCKMAARKRRANQKRKSGEKYAEMLRIRLGTRLLSYLPQRFTPEMIRILADFKKRAAKVGFRKFVIQTHFASPMEVTPEARDSVSRILSAGWIVTNQHVYVTAASRRGHNAKLRQVLNEIGVLPYYTFSTKGYMENQHNFATHARLVQEVLEEKVHGIPPRPSHRAILRTAESPKRAPEKLDAIRLSSDLPFLATDRSVLNLPAVGKSLTFRVIGITRYGRRILAFDHDPTRRHSPIVDRMGRVVIIESKSISEYLAQLKDMGEDIAEYEGLYGYSLGETEPRLSVFDYPKYDFKITDKLTNFRMIDAAPAVTPRRRNRGRN
jgi:lysine 2,3-aminomutase